MIFGIKEHFYNLDPFSVLLSIILVLLKTAFVLRVIFVIGFWSFVLNYTYMMCKLLKCIWFINIMQFLQR